MNRPWSERLPRPPAFSYRPSGAGVFSGRETVSVLHCDEVPLPRLAQRFGTPLYVYSASTLRQRLQSFDRAFGKSPHTVCYSVKANSNLGVLRLLSRLGCGFDVVSGGELDRVLRVDRAAAKRVVFSGVGKTRDEIEAALHAGILLFNIESEEELELLAACAARLRKQARLAVRVNPDVPAETHPYIATGLHQHKFGVAMEEARDLYRRAGRSRGLRVAGVSVHIGSQITEVAPFSAAMERVAALVRQLRKDGHKIQYVDAGGGLGISYQEFLPEFHDYLTAYAKAILQPLQGLKVHLLLEPGRILVGPAGALITAVLYRKSNDSKNFAIVDAAMNDLLRPSLYGAYHEIAPVVMDPTTSELIPVDVVGPVCETGDFFARDRELPALAQGDLLAILDAGAYGMVLASNYNTRRRPAEVLVDGKSVRLIRRRESLADLVRQEK
jgi:diaminopimelate decarboxylase